MIQLQNINFSYSKDRMLFNNLNLSLEGGHVYGLFGKNGAGKTTLLKIMSGLRFIQSGNVTTLGENAALRKAERRGAEIHALTSEEQNKIIASLFRKGFSINQIRYEMKKAVESF